MKIQCNVCEVAEANVLCCADEAALCWSCDEKVHAANKLASKHQSVSLSASSSPMPKCDICQETVGYFFCLEDRALLCRKCDVAIHTANTFVSGHRRFLLTGVKVGLEPTEPGVSASSGTAQSSEKISETESRSVPRKGTPMLLTDYVHISPECSHLISRIFVADPAKRISMSEIWNDRWFLRNLPADLVDEKTMNNQFEEPDQPMQSIEEIMQIIAEATVPAARTQSLNQYLTGSLDIDDEMDDDLDSDLDIDSSGEIVYAM
ncbi:hypothetical protein HYC85_007597 [Camellia sinensis]|uniref:B box-type domain-containing protein n=1 Tax=Camellia sinensis TaxID=4442 RepID=A0A7J7HR96_CAMSI|nr:hypothetical protein HYC85_007597 [Camellia sinensis]